MDTSLDMYRHELALVLYPVFVHMYLELVYNHHEDEAKKLMERFGPVQESYYQEDIKKLSFVTKREHMKVCNTTVKENTTLTKKKKVLRLCFFPFLNSNLCICFQSRTGPIIDADHEI